MTPISNSTNLQRPGMRPRRQLQLQQAEPVMSSQSEWPSMIPRSPRTQSNRQHQQYPNINNIDSPRDVCILGVDCQQLRPMNYNYNFSPQNDGRVSSFRLRPRPRTFETVFPQFVSEQDNGELSCHRDPLSELTSIRNPNVEDEENNAYPPPRQVRCLVTDKILMPDF